MLAFGFVDGESLLLTTVDGRRVTARMAASSVRAALRGPKDSNTARGGRQAGDGLQDEAKREQGAAVLRVPVVGRRRVVLR